MNNYSDDNWICVFDKNINQSHIVTCIITVYTTNTYDEIIEMLPGLKLDRELYNSRIQEMLNLGESQGHIVNTDLILRKLIQIKGGNIKSAVN